MKLSFAIKRSGRTLAIYFDQAGIDRLVEGMREAMTKGHIHFWSPANGGKDLDDETPWGGAAVGEVILTSAEDDDE